MIKHEDCNISSCQVSTDEQVKEGYSLQAQQRKLLAHCESRDWHVVGIYCDEGISGSSIENRPQALKMIEEAKKGLFENILIMKVDRLCRNTKDLLEIVDILKKYNVRLNAVDEQIDYTTPTGKMVLTMLGSFAELERATITNRMMSGKEQKFRNGIYSRSGKRPFGHDFIEGQLVPNEDEVIILNEMYDWVLDGKSLRSLSSYLTQKGIKATSGNVFWDHSTIRFILTNYLHIGYIQFSGDRRHSDNASTIKAKNVVPVIDEDKFYSVRKILDSRSGKQQRKYSTNTCILGDVIYCSFCKSKLQIHQTQSYVKKTTNEKVYKLYYRCNNRYRVRLIKCSAKSFTTTKSEKLFIEYLEHLLLPKPIVGKIEDKSEQLNLNIKLVDNNIQKTILKKKRLLDSLLENIITNEDYLEKLKELNDELSELTFSLENLHNQKDKCQDIRDDDNYLIRDFASNFLKSWNELSNSEKKMIITTNIKRVYINNREIVSIEWY